MTVGVLFNAFQPVASRRGEELSERATETAARKAAAALRRSGFRVRLLPLRDRPMRLLRELSGRKRPAAIVNLCEGFRGCPQLEGPVAGVLELLGIPFTGSPSRALTLCQDKFKTKCILRGCGLPVPEGTLAQSPDELPRRPVFPLMVKPNAEDAGIGISGKSVVRGRRALAMRVREIRRRYGQPALVERFVEGREFNVGVIGDARPRALPVSEILFQRWPKREPKIVGFEAKWRADSPLCRQSVPDCPAHIPAALAKRLAALAVAAYRALGLRGYGRVDFRVDRRGTPFVIEVNPNPAASPDSGLAHGLAAARIQYDDFWRDQVRAALRFQGAL